MPLQLLPQVEIAGLAECVCFKEEQNKEQLMELGYALGMLELLQRGACATTQFWAPASFGNGATSWALSAMGVVLAARAAQALT